jgi:hypothetical protein
MRLAMAISAAIAAVPIADGICSAEIRGHRRRR